MKKKSNCCANCKHRGVGYNNICLAKQGDEIITGFDEVTGRPRWLESGKSSIYFARQTYCKGNWFEPKQSWLERLIDIFK